MRGQVLVAYATKYGGTKEIAEKIGKVLRQAGLQADELLVRREIDLTKYAAVVLGSAVYIGGWRKEAVKFLQSNEKKLAERQVWLFSSGPTGQGEAAELTQGWRFPKGLQPIVDRIQPVSIVVFHGVVNEQKLNPIERWMLKNVQAPAGDFRDWEAITAWAAGIAGTLKEQDLASEMLPVS